MRYIRRHSDEEALVRLQVKGKNVEVTDSIKGYALEKLGKLDKHLNDAARLELELTVERNPSIAQNQVAEATVWTKGPVLRAREASTDMKASIDQLTEKLLRQVSHYRERRSRRGSRGSANADGGGSAPAGVERPRFFRLPERRPGRYQGGLPP